MRTGEISGYQISSGSATKSYGKGLSDLTHSIANQKNSMMQTNYFSGEYKWVQGLSLLHTALRMPLSNHQSTGIPQY